MTIVTTQKELDAALKAGAPEIFIKSDPGVRLHVGSTGSARVVASGSARVVAWGSARVEARGSAHVVASGSARVVASGSAHVEARGSAHVEAWDSAHVEASGSARVVAWDSSRVVATKYTAVHLHSARTKVEGGALIDLTKLDLNGHEDWADYHGVKRDGDELIVYKAVDADLKSGRGFHYPVGETITAPDWKEGDFCGSGLHFSPSPAQAHDYHREAVRFLECAVKISDLSIIDGADLFWTPKLKARSARVLREVDIHGDEVTR